jgi:N-acetylglucosaminyldiphosphoundecaprenol N-acetyl-beta-D-mannosaminyltransferase
VLGVHISAVGMEEAVSLADTHIQQGKKGYVCVTGVHGVMEAQSDPGFRHILNTATITVPDGMPTVWVGAMQGHAAMRRVYGPDYMLELCGLSAHRGYTQYFCGGYPGVAEKLAIVLTRRFPGLKVVGTFTPPFRSLNPREEAELIRQVRTLKPDIIWVGLSTPKQERFMAAYLKELDTHLMIGVGAAFDIHTGRIADAPRWIKAAGLQWLHRLAQEPKRLWKRYLVNNPRFIWNISMQFLHIRTFD